MVINYILIASKVIDARRDITDGAVSIRDQRISHLFTRFLHWSSSILISLFAVYRFIWQASFSFADNSLPATTKILFGFRLNLSSNLIFSLGLIPMPLISYWIELQDKYNFDRAKTKSVLVVAASQLFVLFVFGVIEEAVIIYNNFHLANKTDIHFQGDGYNFTLTEVAASDSPEEWDAKVYLNPTKFTVPEFNFRAGYYLSD